VAFVRAKGSNGQIPVIASAPGLKAGKAVLEAGR
jgi:hypothetical protein